MSRWRHGPKPVIGLVGGIGAGKSTAARLLTARGGIMVDADALGHDALEQPDIRQSIIRLFGDHSSIIRPDGRIDRRAVGRIVFQKNDARRALEAVVLPYIRVRAEAALAAAQADPAARFVVLDAAVMLEAGWDGVCDKVVYVDAPREQRLARVAARSGWSEEELAAREAAQWPAERKMAAAHAVVVNDAGPEELGRRLDELLRHWGIPAG
ncbi:dephospho-CoA kinase [Urbifossiella limnaea]|uniref:dephospho-CoA kinase n=1 Tax=Urbifossiella limnaea TaxID=2528023 RepID=UPI00119FE0A5|nr:dephospho-CoA kinase [Urbifossiella limnaea]